MDGAVKQTNYRKWSFILFIVLLLVCAEGVVSFLDLLGNAYIKVRKDETSLSNIGFLVFIILAPLTFLGGVVCLIMSGIKKENKNYQYWVSAIGYPLLAILFLVVLIKW